jgi:hypothetical protein
MQKTTCLIAVLSLALAGCATRSAAPYADAASCDRTVSVMVIGGKVNLDPDPICVKQKNTKITWEIVSSQQSLYEFRRDSITVGDQSNEFPNCRLGAGNGEVEPGGKRIKCDDKNSFPAQYSYYVRVYWINGGEAANSDPTIWNN